MDVNEYDNNTDEKEMHLIKSLPPDYSKFFPSLKQSVKPTKRILLVDDEPYNIMGMKIVLHQSGIKNLMQFVDIAYNGQ